MKPLILALLGIGIACHTVHAATPDEGSAESLRAAIVDLTKTFGGRYPGGDGYLKRLDALGPNPDPQALATFRASQLNWEERLREPHASIHRLYQALLCLRRREPALRSAQRAAHQVEPVGADAILLRRPGGDEGDWLIVVRLRGSGAIDLRRHAAAQPGTGRCWAICLTTEDAPFSPQPGPPQVDLTAGGPLLHFAGPAAVLMRERHG